MTPLAPTRRVSLGRITNGPVLNIVRDKPPAPVVAPVEPVSSPVRVRVGDFVMVGGEPCAVLRVLGTWPGGWIVNVYRAGEQRCVRHVRVALDDLTGGAS